MKKRLCAFILRLIGWRGILDLPDDVRKCVFCVAPHTSNWDFVLGKIAYTATGRKAGFLMKKMWFFFPLGSIFRAMGGVAVDRARKQDLTSQIVETYNNSEELAIAITPEGTRKRNPHWKKGFYYIALAAKVPIVLAYIDYKKREVGTFAIFYPTGDYNKDIVEIKSYYKDVTPRYPKLFTLDDK